MTDFRLLPARNVAPADLHAAFTAAFADYLIGPFRLPLELWPVFLARQAVDIALSRVAVGNDGILAFALVAPRADVASWRLATMGALPAARGSGAAPALLDDFIARAAAEAGMQRVELECFAQNGRALRLYQSRGFEAAAPLHGYTSDGLALPGAIDAAQAVALHDACAWIDALGALRSALPLQVTPVSLRAQPLALHAWRIDAAQVVAAQSQPGEVTVFSLLDRTPDQRGTPALVAALRRQWPGCSVHVPQLQRDDFGGAGLLRMGLERLPLHQLLMHRRL